MALRARRGCEQAGLVSVVWLVCVLWSGGLAVVAGPAAGRPDGGAAVEPARPCARRERPPVVAAVLPVSGWTIGGAAVTVTGAHFARVVAVTFGRTRARRLKVLSARRLRIAAPKHAAGEVSVVVRTACGLSKPSRRARYRYRLRPTSTPTPTPPITTAAGSGVLSIVAGRIDVLTPGTATATPIGANGVAADAAGDLYIADADNDVVEKVTPTGILSIIAGVPGQSGAPTPGPAAGGDLGDPSGVAVDGAGNLYIADSGDDVVEKVTPDGSLSVAAGVASQSGAPTPGPAASSELGAPASVAVDHAGNLYIADAYNDVVEKVTPAGVLSIVAGVTLQSGAPTAGPAAASDLGDPSGVAVDATGNLYIADSGDDVVEKVTPDGILSVVAGVALQSGAPTSGPAAASDLGDPSGVAVDATGNLYIADSGDDVVEKVTPDGILSVVAGYTSFGGPSPGPATSSNLNQPLGVAVDGVGDLYIADTGDDVVEKVTPGGVLSIVAGVASQSGAPTPGPAASSELGAPASVAVDNAGNLYIADAYNDVVEKVTPAGVLSIIAGVPGESGAPTAGPAARSDLGDPTGVAVNRAGDVYIADSADNLIEQVTPAGALSVIAGDGEFGPPTPGPSTTSTLGAPAGVAVDGSGALYIADAGNDAVEKVTTGGKLSVIAGVPGESGAASPGAATSSDLGDPAGLAVDGSGDVYIADSANDVIEQVTPAGALSVVAGDGEFGPPTPGPATSSTLGGPSGVSVTAAGTLYIADTDNSDVEAVSAR